MKRKLLHPEQIIVPGEYELGNEEILQRYFRAFSRGDGECLPPVLITKNVPEVITRTIRKKAKSKIQNIENTVRNHQRIEGIIDISEDPNKAHWTGLTFGELLMKRFDFSGKWDDFKIKYDNGEFSPLYIDPSVLRLVGETDIFETCERNNERLTYGDEVLTRQQYETKLKELEERKSNEFGELIARENLLYKKIRESTENLRSQGAEYLLVDGKHRATAATLTHRDIKGFLIETNGDIDEAVTMVENGEIRDFFYRQWADVDDLRMSFYDFCKNRTDVTLTLKDRIEMLILNGDLPSNLKDKYEKGKS